jgi:maleate isomerase
MLEQEFPRALKLVQSTLPHVIVFGCTSAGSLGGITHDAELAERIREQTGAHGVTIVASVLERIRKEKARTIAVFTPYIDDLTQSVVNCVREAGYDVVKASGMGLSDNLKIGRVTPTEISIFVRQQMKGVAADCVFLSCTNWQAIAAIPSLREHFGLPVISSNQTAIDAVADFLQNSSSVQTA